MGRLIDADRLKAHYCWWSGGTKEMTIDEAKKTFDTIIDVQPTVEQPQTNATENMVEIVRCKECKWWKTNYMWNGSECKVCVIEAYEPVRNEDDYCSRGERKEDAETN